MRFSFTEIENESITKKLTKSGEQTLYFVDAGHQNAMLIFNPHNLQHYEFCNPVLHV